MERLILLALADTSEQKPAGQFTVGACRCFDSSALENIQTNIANIPTIIFHKTATRKIPERTLRSTSSMWQASLRASLKSDATFTRYICPLLVPTAAVVGIVAVIVIALLVAMVAALGAVGGSGGNRG